MKRLTLITGLILLIAGIALAILAEPQAPLARSSGQPPRAHLGDYTISGPYTHANLTVFLIHGPDKLQGQIPLTLQEAMAQKKAIVHETSQVNQLAIENVSSEEVYVQSGDIVKGGKQDRVLAYDFILPPHSGKLPIGAFCVEHGRWTRRGAESAAGFGGG